MLFQVHPFHVSRPLIWRPNHQAYSEENAGTSVRTGALSVQLRYREQTKAQGIRHRHHQQAGLNPRGKGRHLKGENEVLSNEQCNCQQYQADACFVQENHTAKYCGVDYIFGDIHSTV